MGANSGRALSLSALGIAFVCSTSFAHAYRPFDGTDADVAEEGELELELGPAYTIYPANRGYVTLPAMVLNLGILAGCELVVDAKNVIPTQGVDGQRAAYIEDTDVLLKALLRRGSLQDDNGISIATEFGVLLPNVNGEQGVGGAVNMILSQQWRSLTLHLNVQGARTREGGYDAFSSLIAEGPKELAVRPVLEVGGERELGTLGTHFGLVGAIWKVTDALAFDVGILGAAGAQDRSAELRLGLTWDIAIWRVTRATPDPSLVGRTSRRPPVEILRL